jgi:histidyl-tRNA synthetase
MDYYNLTVFEFITNRLGSQGTICGGGRYDYLVQELGGKPAPAVGWALGVERVLELVNQTTQLKDIVPLDAYAIVMDVTALPLAMKCIGDLRELGVCVQMHASHAGSMGSLKSQFKRADASGANFALIFGADEIAKNSVSVKSLRGSDPIQVSRSLSNIDDWASTLQSHTQFPESHGK